MLFIMHALLISCLAVVLSAFSPDSNSRHTDFKNFEYPWSASAEWPDHLEWLNMSESNHVRLVNGRWREGEGESSEDSPFAGLTLESVQFGDVTGDSRQEAIVTLRFDTGGTQYYYYVYIYSLQNREPVLLAYFHSGDRAASGLYRVYAERGKLAVELFDQEKRLGDCCSSGLIRTRYLWKNGAFEKFGPNESGAPKTQSRIPVSVFGNHK